jgi:hypothetical protein
MKRKRKKPNPSLIIFTLIQYPSSILRVYIKQTVDIQIPVKSSEIFLNTLSIS